MSNSWLHELSGLISASGATRPGVLCEIRVRCGEVVSGIDLSTGQISSGVNATSEVSGDEQSLQRLVRGETTLQSAFRSGAIHLNGDPEPFLRLAMILDRASALNALPA
ncbi:MAG: SCP2 sterol-binding domain-containing protein [Pseudomonadota bacterium]|jgi:hypothetical protein